MRYRRLYPKGPIVSEIGFGGWAIGGDINGYVQGGYGATDDEQSRAAIRRALELGVTYFDTADIYGNGHSETLLGEVIAQWPNSESVIICTKVGINFYREGEPPELDFTPYSIANAVEHSLARLGRERIDLYMVMSPPPETFTLGSPLSQTLASLQRAGKISSVGVSPATAEDAIAILESKVPIDAIEVSFNLLDQGAVRKILPLAKKRKVGVIAREPLANGFLTGKYSAASKFTATDHRSGLSPEYIAAITETTNQLKAILETPQRTLARAALRFVLDEPGIAVTIPGAKTAAQVEENVRAFDRPTITDDEREAIHQVFFPPEG